MEEQIYDSMCDENLTPIDFITLMFDRTEEDGVLYIPGWHYDWPGWMSGAVGSTDENDSYRCQVDWNLNKYEKLLKQYEELYDALQKIAPHWQEIDHGCLETAQRILREPKLVEVWEKYLKRLDVGDMDHELLRDIDDRWETEEWVKEIARNVAEGANVENFEKEVLKEYIDIKTTKKEKEYYNQYISNLKNAAEEQLGQGICAFDVWYRARRLCRLFELEAPDIIIHAEGRTLAAAMLLHKHGTTREIVDNHVRLRLEMLEMMDEDALDELYRPKKMNGRKSLAPLFVFDILSKKTNSKKHLKQQEILKELEKYPYEISLERKALGRMVQNLVDSQYGIYVDKTGVWMEKE